MEVVNIKARNLIAVFIILVLCSSVVSAGLWEDLTGAAFKDFFKKKISTSERTTPEDRRGETPEFLFCYKNPYPPYKVFCDRDVEFKKDLFWTDTPGLKFSFAGIRDGKFKLFATTRGTEMESELGVHYLETYWGLDDSNDFKALGDIFTLTESGESILDGEDISLEEEAVEIYSVDLHESIIEAPKLHRDKVVISHYNLTDDAEILNLTWSYLIMEYVNADLSDSLGSSYSRVPALHIYIYNSWKTCL